MKDIFFYDMLKTKICFCPWQWANNFAMNSIIQKAFGYWGKEKLQNRTDFNDNLLVCYYLEHHPISTDKIIIVAKFVTLLAYL